MCLENLQGLNFMSKRIVQNRLKRFKVLACTFKTNVFVFADILLKGTAMYFNKILIHYHYTLKT